MYIMCNLSVYIVFDMLSTDNLLNVMFIYGCVCRVIDRTISAVITERVFGDTSSDEQSISSDRR